MPSLSGNNGTTTEGWLVMLLLVCNNSSINDSMMLIHTLHALTDLTKDVAPAMGFDEANLLHASITLNAEENVGCEAQDRLEPCPRKS